MLQTPFVSTGRIWSVLSTYSLDISSEDKEGRRECEGVNAIAAEAESGEEREDDDDDDDEEDNEGESALCGELSGPSCGPLW